MSIDINTKVDKYESSGKSTQTKENTKSSKSIVPIVTLSYLDIDTSFIDLSVYFKFKGQVT